MAIESQFKYHTATITSDKDGDFAIDIRPIIVELVFFESLDKPYVSGQIAISDDTSLFDIINFSGTERLNIKMQSEIAGGSDDKIVMDRSFLLTSIDNIVKSSNSGNSAIYVLNFIDEHAFVSKTKNVSRAIRDNLNEEILKLCQNEVGKNVDLSYAGESVQNNFRGVIPYMHPLEAATWLTNKATTEHGMPFFLYASIHDTNLRLGSLDKMLEQPAWNAKIPFTFSPANTQKQETSGDPSLQYFQVQTMKATKLQDTMKQMMQGGIGARYTVTDISNGRTTAQHYNFVNTLTRAHDAGIINVGKQNVYNSLYRTPIVEDVNIGGDPIHELDACIYHNIISRGVYGGKKSIHDEVSPEMFIKKMENASYRTAIYKNLMDVTVPGPGFIKSGGSVGDRIRINVLNDNNDPDNPAQLDKLRSGDFLVYNTRHTFRDTRHDVSMTVFKLERGPNVE